MAKRYHFPAEQARKLMLQAAALQDEQCFFEALELYHQLLEITDAPEIHASIGSLHLQLQQYPEAMSALARAHELAPEDNDVLFNLAYSQKKCGQLADAAVSYEVLRNQEDGNPDTLYNLAGCYLELHIHQEAEELYRMTLEHDPEHQGALGNLGYLLHLRGEKQEALHLFRQLLQQNPNHESAQHMVAALAGETPDKPPVSYVRKVFNNYSRQFEKNLVDDLGYRVPDKLRALVDPHLATAGKPVSALDLGCGTGLAGETFRPLVDTLVGVDLAAAMVEKAKEKKVYDQLVVATLEQFLEQCEERFTLVIAADVFAYIGNLEPLFARLGEVCMDEAMFCFSTEHDTDKPFSLQPSGRYAHGDDHLVRLAERSGFAIIANTHERLRLEGETWLTGTLWLLRKNGLAA